MKQSRAMSLVEAIATNGPLAVGLAIAIMAYGGGAFSLDRVLTRQQERQIS